jgi:hypothetical protein
MWLWVQSQYKEPLMLSQKAMRDENTLHDNIIVWQLVALSIIDHGTTKMSKMWKELETNILYHVITSYESHEWFLSYYNILDFQKLL